MVDHHQGKTQEETARLLALEADEFFKNKSPEAAYEAYREAGTLYSELKLHAEAAQCYARAALCEKVRTGVQSVITCAINSELAAREAVLGGDYANARWHYRDAGLLFEKEGDFSKYSHCFMAAQDTLMKYLWHIFATGMKQQRYEAPDIRVNWAQRLGALFQLFFGFLSRVVWGYGERPFRILLIAVGILTVCAFSYHFSGLILSSGEMKEVTLSEAFYMSGVTFTTLGYGDDVPLGWMRGVAVLEALSELVLMSLFMIGLTRRYLRVYR